MINSTSDRDKEKLSFSATVALGVTSVVGAGIFVLSDQAAQLTGSAVVLAFVVGLIASIVLATCYAELGTMFTGPGGPYDYAKQVFGIRVAAAVGWANVGAWGCASGYVVQGITKYITALTHSETWSTALVSVLIIIFVALNLCDLRLSGIVQIVILSAEALVLGAFVLLGGRHVEVNNLVTVSPSLGVETFFTASLMGFLALTGWDSIVVATSVIKNPSRAIPRAIAVSLTIVGTMYIAVLIVLTGVLSVGQLEAGMGLEDAVFLVAGAPGQTIFTVVVIVGLSATANAFIIVISQSLKALAGDNLIPKFSGQAKHNAKIYIVIAGIIEIFMLLWGSIELSVKGTGVLYTLTFMVSIVALMVCVKRGMRGSFSVPYPKIWLPVSFALCSLFIVGSGMFGIGVAAIVLICGCTISFFSRKATV